VAAPLVSWPAKLLLRAERIEEPARKSAAAVAEIAPPSAAPAPTACIEDAQKLQAAKGAAVPEVFCTWIR
jgi:hypothetical protein